MFSEEEKTYLEATDLDQVKEFIQNTFKSKANGNSHLYNSLVHQLRTRDDADTLWRIYLSLPSRLNLITSRPETYRELIQGLYTFNWIAEKRIIISFMNLVCLFVSSNPIFLIPSLQMLIKNLIPQTSPNITPNQPLSDEYLIELKQRQEYIHRTIHSIFRLAPTAMLEIHPIIIENFPHKRHNAHVQQEYVTQLLLLSESFPQLQGRIIELIFSKCLELDVDIVIEDSGDAHVAADADGEDDGANEFFQLDDNPYQDSFKSSRRRGGMGEEGAMKIRDDVAETAQKLDSILAILLSFIRATHSRSQALSSSTGTVALDLSQSPNGKLFRQMLDAFELRVMTTYKAKYVQFALFFACQLFPPLGNIFLNRLTSLFLDPSNHLLSRQSAVVYLASLIARGQFISFHTAREYLSLLLQWASKYVQQRGQESIPKGVSLQRVDSDVLADYSSYLDMATLGGYTRQGQLLDEFGRKVITDSDTLSRHETFFCCVQSMCYAICFLGISMAQMMSTDFNEKRSWEIVLNSEFHPLRYCIPSVRSEFLRIAAAGDLYHSTLPLGRVPSNLTSTGSATHNPLDTFFPFDPCLLLQVHEQIKEGYRIWENEVVLFDRDESDDGENEDENGRDDGDGDGDGDEEDYEEQQESVEDSGMLSSVASSIASMAFSCGDGMTISLSVGGVGTPSTSYLASHSTAKKSDLRRDVLLHNTPSSNSSSPSISYNRNLSIPSNTSTPNYEGEIISTGQEIERGTVPEDVWIAMLRSKRPRQFSVGSAGSW